MLLEIPGLLNEAQVQKIREVADRHGFVDGRATAGMAASRVKQNEELASDPQAVQLVNRIIMSAIAHNPRFRSAAQSAALRSTTRKPNTKYQRYL